MVHCIYTCDTQLWHFVFVTIYQLASYKEIFYSIPVEDKIATPDVEYISIHNIHLRHSAQQNKAAYQQYKSSLLLPPCRKIFKMK